MKPEYLKHLLYDPLPSPLYRSTGSNPLTRNTGRTEGDESCDSYSGPVPSSKIFVLLSRTLFKFPILVEIIPVNKFALL